MANQFNYQDIFGPDFANISAQLKLLPNDVEKMLLGVVDSMIFNVENFATNLNQTATLLSANGMKSKVILDTLNADKQGAGRIFGQLRNDVKGGIVMATSHSGRMGQYEGYTNKDKFSWVTVAGHKICGDCDSVGGKVKTYEEWETEGLPGSGWSVCKGYCYCVLDPSGKVSNKVKGVNVKEPGAQSKPRSSALTKASYLETIKRHTTTPQLPDHLQKIAGPNAMQRILKKAKLDIDTLVHFPGVSTEVLGDIARGVSETLGRYNLNINFIGKNIRGLTMRKAYAGAWRIANNQYNAITFNGKFLKQGKKTQGAIAERFAKSKKVKIFNAQRRLDVAKANRQYYSSEASWKKAVKEAEENLATWSSPRFSRWSVSEDVYGTTVHESWHIVDYKLNPKELLRVDFQRQLRLNNVDRMEWYHVSEYGGSSIAELWAETGCALDRGLYVPEGIKKAFIKTIENAGYTYP